MSELLTRRYNLGYVDSRDRTELRDGEMQQATGLFYKPADQRAWKLDGRATFGDTGTAEKVHGVALALFDDADEDLVLALSDGVVKKAAAGSAGTFSTLYTLTGDGSTMDAAHANDDWYLALGTENIVVESGGTTRTMGMQAPSAAPTAAAVTAGSVLARPNANDAGWTNMANAQDTDLMTFAHASVDAAESIVGVWSFAAAAGTGRTLSILWSLMSQSQWADSSGGDQGTKINLGALVRAKLEYSVDSGTNYTEIVNELTKEPQAKQVAAVPIADGINLSTVTVRATLTGLVGSKTVYMPVFDIKVQDAATVAKDATELLYAYAEYDALNGHASIPSPVATVTIAAKTQVNLTFPAATNSRATHRKVYRTPAQGSIHQLGLIGKIPIAQTTFSDDFSTYDVDEQPEELVPFIEFESEGAKLRIPRDGAPPVLRRLTYFKGGLVGLSNVNRRGLYYSVPGFPESWPSLYLIESLPFQEHDELVDLEEVGGSLILAGRDVMIRLDDVPRSAAGVFIATDAVAIKGAPGCVGDYGMCAVAYAGQAHAAWISPENGILVTDGHTFDTISRDIAWDQFEGLDKSWWVLRYLKHLRVLVFAYATTGTENDRYFLLHLDRDHLKDGQAKVTGPHYGSIADLVSGQVGSTTRIYSAHGSDGIVYREMADVGTDASNAYDDSGTWPLIILGPARREQWSSWSALDARIYHGDFGNGQTVAVGYTVRRDASGFSATRTQDVSLAGHRGTQFDIARSGEEHEETLTHLGTGRGFISHLQIRAQPQGDEGLARVVA